MITRHRWIAIVVAALCFSGCATTVDGSPEAESQPAASCPYATAAEVGTAVGALVHSVPPPAEGVTCVFDVDAWTSAPPSPDDTPREEHEYIQLVVMGPAEYPQARADQCGSTGTEVRVGYFIGHDCRPALMVDLSGNRGFRVYKPYSEIDQLIRLGELFAPRVERQG